MAVSNKWLLVKTSLTNTKSLREEILKNCVVEEGKTISFYLSLDTHFEHDLNWLKPLHDTIQSIKITDKAPNFIF